MNAVTPLVHSDKPVSKVLVLHEGRKHAAAIKAFCAANDLVPHKVRSDALLPFLAANIDLGGILLADDYGGSPSAAWRTARAIRTLRPELPIFLRRGPDFRVDDVPADLRHAFCAIYAADDMGVLRQAVSDYIFSLVYPNALVRGISEISEAILAERFSDWHVRWDTPFVVHDRVIFGEVLSLIQLESAWCRGYMMLQAEEAALLSLPVEGASNDGSDFRGGNSLLSELTNLIWGSFKNRFIGTAVASPAHQVQVPLIVNLDHRYMSFGTRDPQLCFRYTLTRADGERRVTLLQRFVFNINWLPEQFRELTQAEIGTADAGALELF